VRQARGFSPRVRVQAPWKRRDAFAEKPTVTTFDAVHDEAQPLRVLRGIDRSLTDAGVYLMQDIRGSSLVSGNLDHPLGLSLYTNCCLLDGVTRTGRRGRGRDVGRGRDPAGPGTRRLPLDRDHRLSHDVEGNGLVVRT
jgi:hypothetical protein